MPKNPRRCSDILTLAVESLTRYNMIYKLIDYAID